MICHGFLEKFVLVLGVHGRQVPAKWHAVILSSGPRFPCGMQLVHGRPEAIRAISTSCIEKQIQFITSDWEVECPRTIAKYSDTYLPFQRVSNLITCIPGKHKHTSVSYCLSHDPAPESGPTILVDTPGPDYLLQDPSHSQEWSTSKFLCSPGFSDLILKDHLYISPGWENVLFELGSERVNKSSCEDVVGPTLSAVN